jgi:hypothetical protein
MGGGVTDAGQAQPGASDEAACVAAVTAYIAALNARDNDGVRRAFHFPHVLFARGRVAHFQTAESFSLDGFNASVAADGWARSSLDACRSVLAGPGKIHLDIAFTRWRGDGTAIGVHRSLYIMTRHAGRWGIQARSSYG